MFSLVAHRVRPTDTNDAGVDIEHGSPTIVSGLSVSNSLSGGDWELDEVPAVRDPTHVAQIGRGHCVH